MFDKKKKIKKSTSCADLSNLALASRFFFFEALVPTSCLHEVLRVYMSFEEVLDFPYSVTK